MTYEAALSYLSKTITPTSHPGLERIVELLELCGHPEDKLKFIHVAGTNGKGSTCTMLSFILREAGYKTGIFTSPFLHSFLEYFNIDGSIITEDEFADLIDWVKPFIDQMQVPPTEFELMTVLMFQYFYNNHCDIVVMEAGMGGRLDATNCIKKSEVSVLVNIGLDHQQYLGDTLAAIASEKAGIIKENGIVVCYPSQEEALSVIKIYCESKYAKLIIPDFSSILSLKRNDEVQIFNCKSSYSEWHTIRLHLLGDFQMRNCCLVLEVIGVLKSLSWSISDYAVYEGLLKAKIQSRFDVLCRNPLFIADGGHNVQCIEALTQSLRTYYPGITFTIITGVMKDKNYDEMYRMLVPFANEFIAVAPRLERALPVEQLVSVLSNYGIPAIATESVTDGVEKAFSINHKNGHILAVGTLYMMDEIKSAVAAIIKK